MKRMMDIPVVGCVIFIFSSVAYIKRFMKSKGFICLFVLVCISLLDACHTPHEKNVSSRIRFVNRPSSEMLNALTYHFIPLETTSDNLISGIQQIEMDSSRIYLMDSRSGEVFVFGKDGKFISQVGRLGNGPGEYMQPINLHIDKANREIILADREKLELIHYDLFDFTYKYHQKTDFFTECIWLENGNILWIRFSGFQTPKRESFYAQLTNSNLDFIKNLYPSPIHPECVMMIGSCLYAFNGDAYINLPFLPEIQKVKADGMETVYTIEIEGHSLAPLEWLQTHAVDNYASAVLPTEYISAYCIKETNDCICINFCANGSHPYIGFYSKKDGSSCLYTGTEFMKETGLIGIGITKAACGDFFVATIAPDALKRSASKQPALQKIADEVDSEDNPILCLFKFDK